MVEYIEREAVLRDWPLCDEPADAYQFIRGFPAADVRPVVLCKDCGHWNKENQHPSKWSRDSVAMCAWFSRNYGTIETSEGDWCSYGYQREEA